MRTLLLLVLLLAPVTWVTTAVFADEDDLVYRTFDVSEILAPRQPAWGPTLGMRIPQSAWQEMPVLESRPGLLPAKYLCDYLERAVVPDSFDEVRGAFLELRGSVLHARNTKDAVGKVGALLYEMGAQARARALLSLGVLEGSASAYPLAGEGARLGDSAAVELPLGLHGFLEATNRVQYVVDYDPEIAQASNITDPNVMYPLEGLVADVVAHPTHDASRVVVELFLQQGRYRDGHTRTLSIDEESFNKPFRSHRRSYMGTLECPAFDHVQAYVTALASPGQVVSIPVAQDGKQRTFLLRVESHGSAGRGPLLDLGAITRSAMNVRMGDEPEPWRQGFEAPQVLYGKARTAKPFVEIEPLLQLTQWVVEPEAWEDGRGRARVLDGERLILHAAPGLRKKVEAFLGARESELLRPVVFDVRVYSVPEAPVSGPSRAVDPAAARLLAGARLPTLVGRETSLLAGSTQNFLGDYDVEVAQEARISDPLIGQAFEGLMVSLSPRASVDGRMLDTDVHVVYAVRSLAEEPFDPEAQTLGPIDRVHLRRAVVKGTFRLKGNGTYVIDGGQDPRDPRRRIAIELRAETE